MQLMIYLSNDISRNPGPIIENEAGKGSPYFSFCNWNLNTLSKDDFSRVALLEAYNVSHKYDILSLCETSLDFDETVTNDLFPGYNYHSCNHISGEKKGGVGIFVKDTLPIIIRKDLSFDECLVVELRFGHKRIFFTVLYRNPIYKSNSQEFLAFVDNFRELHSNIENENPYSVIYTGDFNAQSSQWWPDGNETNEGSIINIILSELGLNQLISEPTHFRDHCDPTLIDLIICDQPNLVIRSGVHSSIDSTCKHQITFCKMSIKTPKANNFKRKVWHYSKADGGLIKRAITDFRWEYHLGKIINPNFQVDFLNNAILNIFNNFVPSSTFTTSLKEPKWINKNVKNLLKKQKKLYAKFKTNGFKEEDKRKVDNIKNECFEAIAASKEHYFKSLGSKLIDKDTGQKTYWKILNGLLNKCKVSRIPPLLVLNKIIINCKEKARLFNEYFLEQCKPIANGSILPNFILLTNSKLDSILINRNIISSIIKNINCNKAHGPDNITGRMIELCGDDLTLPLCIIYNNILKTGIFPNIWKSANVTPTHKKDNKQFINNYRPISLLPLFSKIFEKIIFSKMYNYFVSNNLITRNQSGFRPNDSVTNQLLYLVDEIHSSLDVNLDVRAIFLDMSKAFDKVWHDGLLFKLKQNGIGGNLLTLLENYLSNRKQRVLINGSDSDWGSIQSGVPQGSVLGPLLFLIYINDLENGLKSQVKFFADDTSLFSIVKDPNISALELNHDLKLISLWAYQWKMSFNPDLNKQAVEVVFSRKLNSVDHPEVYFNGVQVQNVKLHKHLGLLLDSKLSFATHIYSKISLARKGLGIIKKLSRFLSVKTLDQIFKMYVRPHLDFCDVIYHKPSITNPFDSAINLNYLMNALERIQYHAALAITGTWKGTNLSKIYEELGWESLTDRRWSRRLFHFYKIQNNLTPYYLKIPVPPERARLISSRSEKVLHEIRCNSDSYQNSFYPDSVKSWNNIGHELRSSPSLKSFKASILSLIRPKMNSIFDIHDPPSIKWLYQLRVGLSCLLDHKWKHGFKDIPSDKCQVCNCTESVDHYFLHCTRFIDARSILFVSLEDLNINFYQLVSHAKLKLLLYGDKSFSFITNQLLIKSTLIYLKDTGRFS